MQAPCASPAHAVAMPVHVVKCQKQPWILWHCVTSGCVEQPLGKPEQRLPMASQLQPGCELQPVISWKVWHGNALPSQRSGGPKQPSCTAHAAEPTCAQGVAVPWQEEN